MTDQKLTAKFQTWHGPPLLGGRACPPNNPAIAECRARIDQPFHSHIAETSAAEPPVPAFFYQGSSLQRGETNVHRRAAYVRATNSFLHNQPPPPRAAEKAALQSFAAA